MLEPRSGPELAGGGDVGGGTDDYLLSPNWPLLPPADPSQLSSWYPAAGSRLQCSSKGELNVNGRD